MTFRTLLPMAAILVAAMGLSSCGLEDYEYLYPPSEESSGTTLAVVHNVNNDSLNFLGYQVYYRIYCGTSGTVPPTAATTDAATIEASWSDVYPDVVIKRIKDAGYAAMISADNYTNASVGVSDLKPDPLIDVDSTEAALKVIGTIFLSSEGKWTKSVAGSITATYFMRRNTLDSATSCYRAFDDLEYSSDDCTGTGSYYWIRAYAFAYGLDNDLQPFLQHSGPGHEQLL